MATHSVRPRHVTPVRERIEGDSDAGRGEVVAGAGAGARSDH